MRTVISDSGAVEEAEVRVKAGKLQEDQGLRSESSTLRRLYSS
jgi:hypothetical protein